MLFHLRAESNCRRWYLRSRRRTSYGTSTPSGSPSVPAPARRRRNGRTHSCGHVIEVIWTGAWAASWPAPSRIRTRGPKREEVEARQRRWSLGQDTLHGRAKLLDAFEAPTRLRAPFCGPSSENGLQEAQGLLERPVLQAELVRKQQVGQSLIGVGKAEGLPFCRRS